MGCVRSCPQPLARKESVASSPSATGGDASRIGERVVVSPTPEQATWREQTVLDERNAVAVDADGDALQLAMLGINPRECDSPQLVAAIGWLVGRNDFVAELDRAADDD